jgi:hypothetical protein
MAQASVAIICIVAWKIGMGSPYRTLNFKLALLDTAANDKVGFPAVIERNISQAESSCQRSRIESCRRPFRVTPDSKTEFKKEDVAFWAQSSYINARISLNFCADTY